MEVKVHPFDLDYNQIVLHKESTYKQAKGVIRCQQSKPADATVQQVLDSLSQLLRLPPRVLTSLKRSLTLTDLQSRMTFTDFLCLLQKEAFFRDVLAEAQMYKLSACRLEYGQEVCLVTRQQLEILKQMNKQRAGSAFTKEQYQKLPNFSYLIDHMVLFEFQGVTHLMLAFENKSVQVMDFETGLSLFEFQFGDRCSDQSAVTTAAQGQAQGSGSGSGQQDDQSLLKKQTSSRPSTLMGRQQSTRRMQSAVSQRPPLRQQSSRGTRLTKQVSMMSGLTLDQTQQLDIVVNLNLNSSISLEKRISSQSIARHSSSFNPALARSSSIRPTRQSSVVFSREDTLTKPPKPSTQNQRHSHILGITNPFDSSPQDASNLNDPKSPKLQENQYKKLQKDLNKLFPRTTRASNNRLTNILREDPQSEQALIQETMSQLHEKRQNVVNALSHLKEKEHQKSHLLDRMILLNKAQSKIKELNDKGVHQYDLVQELEDDDAEIGVKKTQHEPLYWSLFPEWGRLPATFLAPKAQSSNQQKTSFQKKQQDFKASKKSTTQYPMCLTYFKPLQLCIFALVSEIVMYHIQTSGNKKVYVQVASHKISQKNEFIPTCLEVALHKVTGRLLVCLAVQSSKSGQKQKKKQGLEGQEGQDKQVRGEAQYDDYVLVYEFDQHNKYAFQEIKRIKSDKPQITKILYRPECGLIMSCFMGYIELFDSIEFNSKGKWDNQITVSTSYKATPQKSTENQAKNTQDDHTDFLDQTEKQLLGLELKKRPVTARPSLTKKSSVNRSSKEEKTKCVATIDCLDYSSELDLIAFGGIQGKIGVLDSTTLSFKGLYDAHSCEVTGLYFNDQQYQMLTMSIDGEIALWDAQKLQIVQVVRSKIYTRAPSINTSFYCKDTGVMLMATSKVYRWNIFEDKQTRIMIEQQHAVAEDFLTQYRKGLHTCGVLKGNSGAEEGAAQQEPFGVDNSQTSTDQVVMEASLAFTKKKPKFAPKPPKINEKQNLKRMLSNKQSFVEQIFKQENLISKNSILHTDRLLKPRRQQSTLPSSKTELAGCFYHPEDQLLFTVDIHCLVRMWDLRSGECVKSYPLEIVSTANSMSQNDATMQAFTHQNKIQFVAIDPTKKFLLVAFQGGVIQIFNIYSGSIVFNKAVDETLDIDQEVANITFFSAQACFWFVASCWDGQVAFFSLPQAQKGREFITCRKLQSYHKRDVTCLDVTTKNYLVTGSIDNLICFWNSYNCTINKQVQIPHWLVPPIEGNTMCALKFAEKTSNEQLLVFMNEGEVFCLDTVSETFIQQRPANVGFGGSAGYEVATIKKFSLVDLKDGFCLSVSEKGEGCLHKIRLKSKQYVTHHNAIANKVTVMLDFVYNFSVSQMKLTSSQAITTVSVHPEQNFFIVGQLDGVVHFMSLREFNHLGQVNDPSWNGTFFKELQPRMPDIDDSEQDDAQLVEPTMKIQSSSATRLVSPRMSRHGHKTTILSPITVVDSTKANSKTSKFVFSPQQAFSPMTLEGIE